MLIESSSQGPRDALMQGSGSRRGGRPTVVKGRELTGQLWEKRSLNDGLFCGRMPPIVYLVEDRGMVIGADARNSNFFQVVRSG